MDEQQQPTNSEKFFCFSHSSFKLYGDVRGGSDKSGIPVASRESEKTEKNRTYEEKFRNQIEKTEKENTYAFRKFFGVSKRFRALHDQDSEITEFLSACEEIISWIYKNEYRSLSLTLVPFDVQEKLHPHICGSLLRSFAKRNRPRNRGPWVLIRGDWCELDFRRNVLLVFPVYRGKPDRLTLPLPDLCREIVKKILFVKLDSSAVELVVAVDEPLDNCICTSQNGDDEE